MSRQMDGCWWAGGWMDERVGGLVGGQMVDEWMSG